MFSVRAAPAADDAGPNIDPGLNLHAVVERAVERNPNQEVLTARVAQADALRRQAQSVLAANPSIAVLHYDDVLLDNQGAQEWETNLDLPIWMPRQRAARLRVAEQTAENARAAGLALRWQIAGLVRDSLWEIAIQNNQLKMTEQQRDSAQKLQADVGKRVKYGDLARSDLILSQQETVARETAVLSAQADLSLALRRYENLTGLQRIPKEYREELDPRLDLQTEHPALRDASATVETAQAEQEQARRETRENPAITLGSRHSRGGSGQDFSDNLTLQLRLPLGLPAQAAPKLANAARALADTLSARELLRRELDLDLKRSARRLKLMQDSLALAQKQNALAQEQLALTRKSFVLGEADLVSLLRVQSLAFNAERNLSQREIELQQAIARYNQAVVLFAAGIFANPVYALEVSLSAAQIRNLNITLARPQKADIDFSETLPAKVTVPNEQMYVVSAPQAGLIENVQVAVGDDVRRGETLAKLQSPGLLELQKDLLQTRTQLRLAKTNLDRDKLLFNEGIIAKRRFLESESAHQGLLAVMSQQEQTLRLAGMNETAIAGLKSGNLLSSRLEVLSPIDGAIIEQMAVAGQRVDAASPLYRVAKLYPLWLEVHTPIQRVLKLQRGARVRVPAYDVNARVIGVGQDVHEADQGMLLRAEVREGAERLRPGQFVQAQIEMATDDQVRYRLPQAAIVRMSDQTGVFLRSPQGFRFQAMRVLSEHASETLVAGTLPDDAQIAVSGLAGLKAAAGEVVEEQTP
jgi:multidrug efflux pump subunit AcrA (membrane-fusion protein)/outer membrane protein TolC